MPTNRRRRRRERRYDLDSPRTRERLASGEDFDFLPGPDLDAAELRAAWELLRGELLGEGGPRPWAWWAFDAREPRRELYAGPDSYGPPDWFGMPRRFASPPPAGMYESEAEYLERLGVA